MQPNLFPWLHILPAPEISLQAILAFLSSEGSKDDVQGLDQRHLDAHASLLRDARLTLTEGGPKAEADRHAIANIIAPLILLGDKAKPTPHSTALQRLLRATGLTAPPHPRISLKPLSKHQRCRPHPHKSNPAKALLARQARRVHPLPSRNRRKARPRPAPACTSSSSTIRPSTAGPTGCSIAFPQQKSPRPPTPPTSCRW